MVLLLRGAGGVVTGTCVLKSFRFRSACFSRVALVLKPWPFFALLTTWRKSRGRVLLGILGGGEPPSSLTPGLISNQKNCHFPRPFSILDFRQKLCHRIRNISFSFLFINLELKRQIRSYATFFPSKTIANSKPKWAKCIPVFRPKKRKNHILWGGTYLCGLQCI